MKNCPTCGMPWPSGEADILRVLQNDADAYVYRRGDGRGWSITQNRGTYPTELIRKLKNDGNLVARWPGSEAGDDALTIPKHAMSRDQVADRLKKRRPRHFGKAGADHA